MKVTKIDFCACCCLALCADDSLCLNARLHSIYLGVANVRTQEQVIPHGFLVMSCVCSWMLFGNHDKSVLSHPRHLLRYSTNSYQVVLMYFLLSDCFEFVESNVYYISMYKSF